MDITTIKNYLATLVTNAMNWLGSSEFYAQLGLSLVCLFVAYWLTSFIKKHSPLLNQPPSGGRIVALRTSVYKTRTLILPLLLILGFSICADISDSLLKQSGLVRFFLSLAMLFLLYTVINRLVEKQIFRKLAYWILIPIAVLHIFGWLDVVVNYLESVSIHIGNIKISAYGIVRVLIFGTVLFWLGRISNNAGQQIIRSQEELDIGTREVFAKLFQVALFFIVFILLLQIMGINLTTLAVFGGAVGVGLGFGLQAIASNFISGIIILLDRTLSVGDYIELEDGRKGTIRALNMRSTTLETYDGKDIMVPNEQFITTTFTNWTHKNIKQRYSLEIGVAYKTDLHQLFPVIREVVASHPKVISGDDVPIEERPDVEISGFGDSSVNLLIEFWMEGVDDGEHRVGGDLLLMIWDALHEHNVEIPFPQREVRILNPANQ